MPNRLRAGVTIRALPLLLLLAACAGQPQPTAAPVPPAATAAAAATEPVLRDLQLAADTVWEGRLLIDGAVTVRQGAILTIRPGTEIAFLRRDDDGDGVGDATLIVEGALHAEGTRAQPIRFRSAAAARRPGDWLQIRLDSSPDVRLRWCEISDSAQALHGVLSRGFMEDCTIRGNLDGSRFAQADFAVRHCLIEENAGKGLSVRSSQVEIARNIIRYNGVGIFFEDGAAPRIRDNNLHGNGDNLRLAEGAAGDFRLAGNWWGTADRAEAERSVSARRRAGGAGKVLLDPAPAWISGTGPRDRLALQEAWRFATTGFVDAGPVVAHDAAYVVSWDGHLYALGGAGELLWKRDLADVLDTPPALEGGAIFLQSWQREVYALDRRSGREIWRFSYAPSAADDDRQGGVVHAGDLLLVPAWNGNLYALEAVTGGRLWQVAAGQPLRAAPAVVGDRIYQVSGSGLLTAWTLAGEGLWQVDLRVPLLATPATTPEGPVVISRDGLLLALDDGGRERWRRQLGEECYYGAPLYAGRALYVGTAGGTLWKVDAASGRTIWRLRASGPIYGQPLLTDGRLVVGDNSGHLLVVGADSGDLLASFRAEGEIHGRPARLGNRIVFGSRDHRVYALELLEVEAGAMPRP